ncbi:hypothetical protein IWQ54_002470 [Labrenzia sp. EL_195]|nr:hypothetical protein [Labrenzia sp. EL_195]
MAIDIGKIFTATAQSTRSFLITNGQGCYIPAYQRPYSWDRENVDRLYEDATHGLSMLLKQRDTISFLGTIIAIHDTKYKTIQPIYKPEVASKVMTIIDGQQRICTFMMTNIALHDQISKLKMRFKKGTGAHLEWIVDQAERIIAELEDSIVIDMKTGDDLFRYYPRVIRSFDDVWSRRKGQAKYESPIARLIWDYFQYADSTQSKAYRYDPKDEKGKALPTFQTVVETFKHVQKRVRDYTGNKASEVDFPDLLAVIQSEQLIDAIWGFDLPEEVTAYVSENSEDEFYESFCHIFRSIIFSQYLSNRMAFTVVTTESEDDAFDMFEALNTTGEPLTAFETFRPKVIDAEGIQNYEGSDSFNAMKRIEAYLDAFKKAEQKQKATSEMLVPFALAETGDKLQKRLNDQRRYLREQYESADLKQLDEKRLFVKRLADTASFMKYAWDVESGKVPSFDPLEITDAAAIAAFDALRELKHHVTVAHLSTFYGRAIDAEDEDERKARTQDFVDAIKATAAFSMLWRGAHGNTSNIDSLYRDLMRQGLTDPKVPPMAKRPKDKTGYVSIGNYKKALRALLEKKGGFTSKEEWVKAAARQPIYAHSAVITRFLLFAAADDAIPDTTSPGNIKTGRSGIAPMLAPSQWRNTDFLTVEHIAPRNSIKGWPDELYEEPDTINRLGNLVLLPQEANSVVGNRSWAHKRLFYQVFASEDEESFNSALAKFAAEGLNISKKANEVLSASSYLTLCKAIAQKEDDWTLSFVEERSKRIAELAWDRIHPWLVHE